MSSAVERLEKSLVLQVRVELVERGLTQQDLAVLAGITRESVNKYLQSRGSIPMPVFFRFAEVFSIEPFELLRRASERAAREEGSTGGS